MVNLPVTGEGMRHLLVFVDVFLRWVEVVPVVDLTMSTFVEKFIDWVICRHGCPGVLVLDRGGQFLGDLSMAIYKKLQIKKNSTTAYHPMANGLCERFNQALIRGIQVLGNEEQDSWDQVVVLFGFAYNTTVHAVTGYTPFELMYGALPRVPADVAMFGVEQGEGGNYGEVFRRQVEQMSVARGIARERIQRVQERNKQRFDHKVSRKHKVGKYFQPGDRVWLYNPVVPVGLKRKLCRKWYGPFVIVRRKPGSEVNYELETPAGCRMHTTVHVNRLVAFYDGAQGLRNIEGELEGDRPEVSEAMIRELHGEKGLGLEGGWINREIVGLRFVREKTGYLQKEYLIRSDNLDGDVVEEWVNGKKILAGHLIREFEKRQREQAYGILPELDVAEDDRVKYDVETQELGTVPIRMV